MVRLFHFTFFLFLLLFTLPTPARAANASEEAGTCRDGMINIRPQIPSFGYLRCPDTIYSFNFNSSLFGEKGAFCDIRNYQSDARGNRMECKTTDDQIIVLTWPNGNFIGGKMIVGGVAHYPDGKTRPFTITVTIIPSEWGHW